ncbi:MAG: 4,5-DOPA dioxygenase extradiol [Chloroflexi bacterium]|nr:4,5-DOPA dioxygenase extradiol [Chloroflexota bacterium]
MDGEIMLEKMPVLFVGHGSPMNAIEDNEFSRAWVQAGKALPKPKAILCVSAHWVTRGTLVTAMEQPRMIYDMYGFPRQLYEVNYPAPGAPDLAEQVRRIIRKTEVQPDHEWGLDHGTWSVLNRLFPEANVPVIQLSLNANLQIPDHYETARQLRDLRREGVLVIGSGNIVHNLSLVEFRDFAYDWAREFDHQVRNWILADDHDPIVHYEKHGQAAQLAINTAEHYVPLLYSLALKEEGEPISFFAEKVWGGSVSMRSVRFG